MPRNRPTLISVNRECGHESLLWNWNHITKSLQWHHNGRDCVSNHQPHDWLLSLLSRRTSKKTSKLRVTGLCAGNSSVTSEFPAQMGSNAENISIWWRHHGCNHSSMSVGYFTFSWCDSWLQQRDHGSIPLKIISFFYGYHQSPMEYVNRW